MTQRIIVRTPRQVGPRLPQSTPQPVPSRETAGARICQYRWTASGTGHIIAEATQPIVGWDWRSLKIWGNSVPVVGWAILIHDVDLDEDRWVPLGCVNSFYFSAEGYPAGGSTEWDVTVNGVTEVITFPCPCTIAQTIAALEGHSEIAAGEVSVSGGTLPAASQRVNFASAPTFHLLLNSLTRSWTAPPVYYWDVC